MKGNLVFFAVFAACLALVTVRTVNLARQKPFTAPKKDELLMDRYTLSHALVSIFGEGAKPVVLQDIFELGSTLGGSCDFYEMAYDGHQKIADPFTRCPAAVNDINAPMFVKGNALRTAAVAKACGRLTAQPELVNEALKISGLKPGDPVTRENLHKLHFTFFKAPPEKTQAEAYAGALASRSPSWSGLANSICSSNGWQLL